LSLLKRGHEGIMSELSLPPVDALEILAAAAITASGGVAKQ
jgi:hypothetical protein